jgi:transmembrane sensor
MQENADPMDDAASEWVAKIDRGLTDGEAMALKQWLATDSQCREALERAQAVWKNLDRAQVFRIADEARRAPREVGRDDVRRGTRRIGRYAAAVAVAVAAMVSAGTWFSYERGHLSTTVGEIRLIPLNDGSRVTLDTGSRIAVDYEPQARLVRLESGEALFEVASDPTRPFVVQAGNIRVRAVGTAFLVRRHSDDDVDVTVTKGTVDVWCETRCPAAAVRLKAGTATSLSGEKLAAPRGLTAAQIERAIVWKSGVVDLNGRTLGEAAEELNRYNRLHVVVDDPHLAAQTLVGSVSSSDPSAFAEAAAAMFGAHVRREGDRLVLESMPAPQK